MNELQTFVHPDFGKLRALKIDGDPWFVSKDAAEASGYEASFKAIQCYITGDDQMEIEIPTPGGTQSIRVINEFGLYCIIMATPLPFQRKRLFLHWMIHDVIPAVCKADPCPVTPQPLQDLEIAATQARAQLMSAKNLAAKRLTSLWDRLDIKPEDQLLALHNFYAEDGFQLPVPEMTSPVTSVTGGTYNSKARNTRSSAKKENQA